jgi:hypothetical protein
MLTDRAVEKTDNIIQDIVSTLDDMGKKTKVKEEVEKVSSLQQEFDNFRISVTQKIAGMQMSGSGSGETSLEYLDDVQRSTAKVDGKILQYSSSASKWIGVTAGAADELSAGDAAINLTTTSGNITIDAAASNSDIIFKGTDGGSDITMLTLDGSDAGAASFNSTVTATGFTIGSAAIVESELEMIDAITAGTVAALKAVVVDSNKDAASFRNITLTGELDAGSLDVSGNVDVDGTLEADAYTVDGTTLAEYIADTAGAMVSSNTETGITVTYQDGDNTLDFVVGTLNQDTTGTADNFTVSANNSTNETVYPVFVDGATGSQGAETDTGLSYNPSTGVLTTTSVTGNLTGNVSGDASGTAATVTGAAQAAITSLGTLTTLTVDSIIINGTTIGHTSDDDAIAINSSGNVTVSQSLTISGDLVVSGTTRTVDTVTMDAANAIVFEGASADDSETTLSIVDPDADRTQYLINQSGYVPLLAAVTTTAITSTPEELNILDGVTTTAAEINLIDGDTSRSTTAVASGDGILINDGGTMRMTNVDTVSTYFASHTVGGGNIVTTGALDSGSITSGFGAIDNGTSNIRSATITAETAFVPDASGGADLGTTALEFNDAFFNDGAIINFGDDQDVTLTHVADTGLLLNSTMQLQFNDASQYINAPSATVLDINATDEIELNATLVDINANVEISGTATTTGIHTFTAIPVLPANTIDSDHYVDDSIDTAHYAAGSVDATALGADCVTAAKIGDNVINSEHYAADSIDAEHYAAGSVDATAIGDDVVNSQHYAADSIDEEHIANDAVGSAELKSLSTLLIKNSSGSTLKTIHGAGA